MAPRRLNKRIRMYAAASSLRRYSKILTIKSKVPLVKVDIFDRDKGHEENGKANCPTFSVRLDSSIEFRQQISMFYLNPSFFGKS